MKLLLDIQDNKADALMKVLKDLPYVKTQLLSPAKALFLTELKEAVTELNLVKAGKKKARNAEEFLNEL
jgi:hypothetical protein